MLDAYCKILAGDRKRSPSATHSSRLPHVVGSVFVSALLKSVYSHAWPGGSTGKSGRHHGQKAVRHNVKTMGMGYLNNRDKHSRVVFPIEVLFVFFKGIDVLDAIRALS